MNPKAKQSREGTRESADPLIDEVRRFRHEISAEFGHDPYKLVEYYMRLQEQHRERLVDGSGPECEDRSAA
jgi:hypothetical protein